jgi:hypothetical protein
LICVLLDDGESHSWGDSNFVVIVFNIDAQDSRIFIIDERWWMIDNSFGTILFFKVYVDFLSGGTDDGLIWIIHFC